MAQVIERKRWERDLKESVAYLESVFRAAPVGIGVNVNRVFCQVNQRLCQMTGYASEELIGRNARMLYIDDAGYEHVGRVMVMCQRAGILKVGFITEPDRALAR